MHRTRSTLSPSAAPRLWLTAVLVLISLLFGAPLLAANGTGIFDPRINWSGTLHYHVLDGPPSTCGDLHVIRNGGTEQTTTSWLCTDSHGNATKGPWYHSNQSVDETGTSWIEWPDGTQTTRDTHIWDVDRPDLIITSGLSFPVPTAFYGKAVDPPNGAGFGDGNDPEFPGWESDCHVTFYEVDTALYWSSGSDYTSGAKVAHQCSLSPLPAHTTYWTPPAVPPEAAHTPGYCYVWKAWCRELPSRPYETVSTSFCR